MAGAGDELVDIVDEQGRAVAMVERRQMRAENLWHRCVLVAVLRSSGELVVHQRAGWKDLFPLHWDLAFGGVCGLGEPWAEAAARELAEEAGITGVELIEFGGGRYEDEHTKQQYRVFLALTDEPVVAVDDEVVDVGSVAVSELASWVADNTVCGDSAAVLVPLVPRLVSVNGRPRPSG